MPRKGEIINRTGEEGLNTYGRKMKVVESFGIENNTIEFDNGYRSYYINYRDFKTGQVKNPYDRKVYGIGYHGEGRHKTKVDGVPTTVYSKWIKMLQRCYGEEEITGNKTYVGCTICEEWECFQNFGDWFEERYDPISMKGWNLDKDIRIKGNKVYSPETCCLIPQSLNKLFTKRQNDRGKYPLGVTLRKGKFEAQISINGIRKYLGSFKTEREAFQVYKIAKEARIKEVADEWRPLIGEEAYQAMYNWVVEITD